MKKKFGELLIERGLISSEQLADALALQRRRGIRLGAALVALGHLDETQLVEALGSVLHFPVVDLGALPPDFEAIRLVSGRFAQDHSLFPYALRKERSRRILSVAMADPLNYRVIDELSFMTDTLVEPTLARASDIDAAIAGFYHVDRVEAVPLRLGHTLVEHTPNDADKTIITIVRQGGVEEVVDTATGHVLSPPRVGETMPARAPLTRPDSALLLTEEVPPTTPVDGEAQAPSGSQALESNGQRFDAALGALIDAAGAAVQTETLARLERRFWALMRILAKKGLLTKEEFLIELGED